MSKEIVAKVDKEELSSEHITFTPYGVEFTEERPTIEEWHKAFLGVQSVHGMAQFYLGDLAVFAQSEVTGWGKSKYDALVDATGYNPETIRSFASVARRFSPEFRESVLKDRATSHGVSWGHFRTVMSLPDEHAKYFLEMVRDGRWTVTKLREELIRYRNDGQLPEDDASETPIGHVSFKNQMRDFFRGFSPRLSEREYDKKSWLLEVRDVIDEELERLGVINGQ